MNANFNIIFKAPPARPPSPPRPLQPSRPNPAPRPKTPNENPRPQEEGEGEPNTDLPDPDDADPGSCSRKRAPCAPDPRPLPVAANSLWRTGRNGAGIEELRLKGFRALDKLDIFIKEHGNDDDNPNEVLNDGSKENFLQKDDMYFVEWHDENPEEMPIAKYFDDQTRFESVQFDSGNREWPEIIIKNSEEQVKKYKEWVSKAKEDVKKKGYFESVLPPADEMIMLRTFQDTTQGAIIIKNSENEKNDLRRSYNIKDEHGNQIIERPQFGDKKPIRWSDQVCKVLV
jgi:hypothetical protein